MLLRHRPERSIMGSHTGLGLPACLAIDANGDIYAANTNSITVYTPDAAGEPPPLWAIVGAHTRLTTPARGAVRRVGGALAQRQSHRRNTPLPPVDCPHGLQ